MVDKEVLYCILPALGWFLFSLGGLSIKWARRYLLPFFFLLFQLACGILWWKALLVSLLYVGVFSLGYGESKPYWYKFLVGVLFAAPTLILGFSVWQIIIPIYWITMFALSNWKPTSKIIVWKFVEGSIGAVIAFNLATLIGK